MNAIKREDPDANVSLNVIKGGRMEVWSDCSMMMQFTIGC